MISEKPLSDTSNIHHHKRPRAKLSLNDPPSLVIQAVSVVKDYADLVKHPFITDNNVSNRHHPLSSLSEGIKKSQTCRFGVLVWRECGLDAMVIRGGNFPKAQTALAGLI